MAEASSTETHTRGVLPFIQEHIKDVNRRLNGTMVSLMNISEDVSYPHRHYDKNQRYIINDYIGVTNRMLSQMDMLINDLNLFRRELLTVNEDLQKAYKICWHLHDIKKNNKNGSKKRDYTIADDGNIVEVVGYRIVGDEVDGGDVGVGDGGNGDDSVDHPNFLSEPSEDDDVMDHNLLDDKRKCL